MYLFTRKCDTCIIRAAFHNQVTLSYRLSIMVPDQILYSCNVYIYVVCRTPAPQVAPPTVPGNYMSREELQNIPGYAPGK